MNNRALPPPAPQRRTVEPVHLRGRGRWLPISQFTHSIVKTAPLRSAHVHTRTCRHVFPNRIAQLRRQPIEPLSQADLANKVGISARQVGRIETGDAAPDACVLWQISMALAVPVADLYLGHCYPRGEGHSR